jgi:hypothetical protein
MKAAGRVGIDTSKHANGGARARSGLNQECKRRYISVCACGTVYVLVKLDDHVSQAWYTGVMELMILDEGLAIYCDIESIVICVRQARQGFAGGLTGKSHTCKL